MTWPIELGDLVIDRVVEEEHGYNKVEKFIPALRRDQIDTELDWLEHDGLDRANDTFVLSYHSYVLRTPQHCIVIDTCVGNDKTVPNREAWNKRQDSQWLANFTARGFAIEEVDYVVCTHLHHDHIGWNTRLVEDEWVPTFPNATYVFNSTEYDYWRTWPERNEHDHTPLGELRRFSFAESVQPIVDAGRAKLVPPGEAIDDYLRFIPTAGHTPGHSVVAVGLDEDVAVFTGDLIHSPIQAVYPDVPMPYDWDTEVGARSRREFLERYSGTSTLVCTMHFPSPSAGYVRPWKGGFRLHYIS